MFFELLDGNKKDDIGCWIDSNHFRCFEMMKEVLQAECFGCLVSLLQRWIPVQVVLVNKKAAFCHPKESESHGISPTVRWGNMKRKT